MSECCAWRSWQGPPRAGDILLTLLAFLKRHPNPEIARLIQLQDKVQGCELIGRFRLN